MQSVPQATEVPVDISFVIPVLNEADSLPAFLAGVRSSFPDAELIVVDGGSTDSSVACAMPLADLVLVSSPGRATQMNLGAACARGDWLAFLHADAQPEFNQEDLLVALSTNLTWGFCRVALRGETPGLAMVSAFMNQRSRLTCVATGDQLLVLRRGLFEDIDGFAAIPLMEDVEICKRLRDRSPGGCLPLTISASGRRWDEQGLWRTIARMWVLRFAYWLGVSPERLWRHYYGAHALAISNA